MIADDDGSNSTYLHPSTRRARNCAARDLVPPRSISEYWADFYSQSHPHAARHASFEWFLDADAAARVISAKVRTR
jgi:hypothetical protein